METEVQKIEAEEVIEKKGAIVEIDKHGGLAFTNQTELGTNAKLAIKMRTAPQHLIKEGLEAVMSCMLFLKQFNLPLIALNEMGYVKGKPTPFGSLIKALAERHPEYGEQEEFFVTKEGDRICVENKNLATGIPWAHVTRIKKKNSTVWNEYFFSVEDAEKAGLLTKNTSQDAAWIKYTKDLLYHKSKSRAMKSNYASALNGADCYEEVMYEREVEETKANDLNKMF